ncbi:class I SAM-dependent methyltransferase [Stenotrophomonas oahuensis]|uniref:Class I SAM-dependent methyltransferase n=1 Tax=Stenotrophomonas oahuensis TaxID=3003271 RepID=A0ABY9YND2_9GAMM|nr:class I SAM-dependent methyltransferase [Stenotrophomonas sp. A5586]WNH52111.1 class I SAM-dependent methyltransferase [Stenotrophomonas sp. A5586]
MSTFQDAAAVSRYQETALAKVPGMAALHRMTHMLLAESVPADGEVLVLGAGGGLELSAFAQAHSGWRFVGVDPSAPMLELAQETLGAGASRVELVEGFIEDAPVRQFDGATCLLTLHFLDREGRLRTLRELFQRLKPGGVLVVAHHSYAPEESLHWLRRSAAFASASGVVSEQDEAGIAAMAAKLPALSAQDEVALLETAGFVDVELFYAALSFRGWVARRLL